MLRTVARVRSRADDYRILWLFWFWKCVFGVVFDWVLPSVLLRAALRELGWCVSCVSVIEIDHRGINLTATHYRPHNFPLESNCLVCAHCFDSLSKIAINRRCTSFAYWYFAESYLRYVVEDVHSSHQVLFRSEIDKKYGINLCVFINISVIYLLCMMAGVLWGFFCWHEWIMLQSSLVSIYTSTQV